jgi:chromosome segregation ATPase
MTDTGNTTENVARTLDLPEHRTLKVQAAVAEQQRLYEQLDRSQEQVAGLTAELRAAEMRIAALEAQVTEADSRARTSRLERDGAVAERAVLEALFQVLETTIEKTKRPRTVLEVTRRPPTAGGEDALKRLAGGDADERAAGEAGTAAQQ